MITLRNGLWGARISETGAELKSLAFLATGQEHIWHGDPAWWSGSAPVLFPVIGGLKGGPARALKLTAEERSQVARRAAQARWSAKGK